MPAFGNQNYKIFNQRILRRFDNFARFYTAGTNFHPPVSAGRKLDADRLQVGIKASPGFVVRVGNIVSKLRAFPAYFASFSHKLVPPYNN